ncbi:diguanylate cyclase (GGDEF) domain-containing protein [Humidesulfovibrio mexicanus]|uniref:diguanylate cyclase n=1 Tax=Humidesulfovibrio mexicanus TaxID=147047 RepID=A0A239BIK5_9BACT|nr:diguanylate cyclase [Humidesulfovibrio mexicanus]SNS07935.1 diguanylate cyclase (GGDEF) domain-containing protein [Humidesulfovibrio mexicanus]
MRPAADIPKDILADTSVTLTRQDLIDLEHSLKDAMRSFLPFTSYSLYFPREDAPPPELRYDADARELLLPLTLVGRTLGVFVARGVRLKAPKAMPPLYQAMAGKVLEQMLLYKRSVTDALTGLSNREHFQQTLTREIALIRHCLEATSGGRSDPDVQCFSAALGVILLDLDNFQWINERYGYALGDEMVAKVGASLAEACPRHATAARIHNDTFAVLLPDASAKGALQLAEQVRQAIGDLGFQDEVTGDRIGISASLGYANYPQCLRGPQLERSPAEAARILMRAAAKAVGTSKDHGRNRVFGFQDIVRTGGRILEVLPMQRLSVTLGRGVGAQEGLRYLVWSPRFQERAMEARLSGDERLLGRSPALYKGEIVLTEVQEDLAIAEVLHAGDPSWAPEPGDRLTLIQERDSLFASRPAEGCAPGSAQRDMLTGLYAYRDFLSFFERGRGRADEFCVVLTRVAQPSGEPGQREAGQREPGREAEPDQRGGAVRRLDAAVAQVAALAESLLLPLARPSLPAERNGKPARPGGGRFGLGGLVHFLPGADGAEVLAKAEELCSQAAMEHGLDLAVGVYRHPCLKYAKADALDCARKALEHALLLPAPRVARFDSLSLNVSGDRLFASGDLYAAVEEFKLSLLADPSNVLARTSLGICHAQLGKPDLARREFELVVAAEPGDVMAHYNLGWACQRLGETGLARQAYQRCLELDPAHCYSLLRLGSLAESDGLLDEAEELYARALAAPGGEAAALRPLARVALAKGQTDRARELLHLAIGANHNDALALSMLARLYLDAGEDPQIAEVLARQSAALMPERQEHWDALVTALTRQGRLEEARKAASRTRP